MYNYCNNTYIVILMTKCLSENHTNYIAIILFHKKRSEQTDKIN